MIKNLLIALLIAAGFSLSCQGQLIRNFGKNVSESFQHRPKFIFSFDTRHTFIGGQDVKIFGLKPGLEFDRIRLGLGLYFMADNYRKMIIIEGDTATETLKAGYLSLYGEYVLFQNRKWEFSIPLSFGFGSSYFHPRKEQTEHSIILIEPAVMGHYKIIPWLGIGAGVGYRQMLVQNKYIKEEFNNIIYVIKLKIFLGQIYRDIFKKDK